MSHPVVILPGYLAGFPDYLPLQASLTQLGYDTEVVPVRVRDWFPTLGGRSIVPILRFLDRTIQATLQRSGAEQVTLVGHSAGGWIARIYLGEKPYTIHGDVDEVANLWNARDRIARLITLGTPHTSYERWTRKNLNFVNDNYPGAFYPEVRYVCVAGKALYGQRRWGQWLAYESYQMTGGDGNTWGDGITPVEAAHLEGAENLTLEGVYHSPRSPGSWYGSPEVIPQWAGYLA